MPQSYATVETFFRNADAHSAFLARVTARLVEWAVSTRAACPASPTGAEYSRQAFAVQVLQGQAQALARARALLPALAVKANDAGLIAEDGTITATDAQITATVDDDFVDLHAGYIPEAA
jgi:hypothetical protein